MTNLDKQCSSTIIATFTYHAEMVLELEFLYEYWIGFVTMKFCMSKLRSLSSYMIGEFRTPELIVIVLWCHGIEPLVSDIVGCCFKTKFYTTPGLYVLLIYIIHHCIINKYICVYLGALFVIRIFSLNLVCLFNTLYNYLWLFLDTSKSINVKKILIQLQIFSSAITRLELSAKCRSFSEASLF